ncbi:LolA-related protein [Dokdonella sp. MW10]|uniref:LolA-related protein n=1 Tax=Dokdonella sp. MW10 TaxID=2992926 RepID=UPI003F8142A4
MLLPCLAAAADPDPQALVAGLARPVPARTAYTEVRFAQMLDRPLVVRGELEYLGPGKLGKRVDTPYKEQTTIADGQVSVQRGTRKPREIALGQVPELEGFLRGFSALLGGDAAVLAQDFTLTTRGTAQRWHLSLVPKDARLKRRVASIEVDGDDAGARCFGIVDADGDANILLVEALASAELPKPLTRRNVEITCAGTAPK